MRVKGRRPVCCSFMPLAVPLEWRLGWRSFLRGNEIMDHKLSDYEAAQVEGVRAWKKEEPGVISQGLGFAIQPFAWLVRQIVPEKAMVAAIEGCNTAGMYLADQKDLVREASVKSISQLKKKDLQLSDSLADSCQNWAIGIAAAEGAAAGAGGIFTAPIDIPAIITLAFRTIHKVGLCYGYECKTPVDNQFVLGIVAASGANSMEEKVGALASLKIIERVLVTQTWKKMGEKAAETVVSKEGAIIAIRGLAKQLGVNLTKRRALAAIPFIGAAVGGTMNAWYIKEVGWAARRAFQERWLLENKKITEINAD